MNRRACHHYHESSPQTFMCLRSTLSALSPVYLSTCSYPRPHPSKNTDAVARLVRSQTAEYWLEGTQRSRTSVPNRAVRTAQKALAMPAKPKTPKQMSQIRIKCMESAAIRGLLNMYSGAKRGSPLSVTEALYTVFCLNAAARMRNVHSRYYYGSIDKGHQFRVELLDRVLAETLIFIFIGRVAEQPATAKILRMPLFKT
ncbi:hypothetical protein ElyMa_002510200 [Elysia marginata]|uniref:Uncharacterized protein n=1 Tax=Elysia marginata TaxID=1093978 RepID=A0AAV4GUC6_9GAST|nr:hypothetical protein ElyMa_002510200 [Elysia marginata]